MKSLVLFVNLFLLTFSAFAQKCSVVDYNKQIEILYPDVKVKRAEIEKFTQTYINSLPSARAVGITVTIPVVIHNLYHDISEKVDMAQINSQMVVLNAAYAKKNADTNKIPSGSGWKAANTGIRFVLATVDPNGNTTNGVRWVSTTKFGFSIGDPALYSSALGGDDIWPPDRYLNIYVTPIGYLGWAQYPGGPTGTDAVVVKYDAFGTTGYATRPYHLGKTVVHEVGHWAGLWHIWGDADCGNDFVNDTPVQFGPNWGKPIYPKLSPTCTNLPPYHGDMFCNYMDYVDDDQMVMFSAGQVDRMEAAFATGGGRSSFVTVTTPPITNALVDGATYTIQLSHDNLYVDTRNGAVANNTAIVQNAANNTTSQQWIARATTNGYYRFQHVKSGKYLSIQGANITNGIKATLYELSASAPTSINKEFKPTLVTGTSCYTLTVRLSTAKCLEVPNSVTTPNIQLDQLTCSTAANMQFKFTRVLTAKIQSDLTSIYPNPTSDQFSITSTAENTNVIVYASDGHIVAAYDNVQNGWKSERLKPGLYLVIVNNQQHRLIVQ